MTELEYKTVAMPQLLRARRRRGQSQAEMVAEIVSEVINRQAELGWRYVGADQFRTIERRGVFGRAEEKTYTVLVFNRPADEEAAEPAVNRRRAEPAGRSGSAPRRREPAAAAPDFQEMDEPRETQRSARDGARQRPAPAPRRSEGPSGAGRGEPPRRSAGLMADRDPAPNERPARRGPPPGAREPGPSGGRARQRPPMDEPDFDDFPPEPPRRRPR